MHQLADFLASQPGILLFLLVGIGAVVGKVRVSSLSLGAAAVLFVAIAGAAWAASLGVTWEIPHIIGMLGLSLFTFSVGVASGPEFFHTMRKYGVSVLGVALAIVLGGVIAFGVGPLLGLSIEQSAGTFAGALTNTPALAAAGDSPEATVGYSVAYLFGVIGVLVVQNLAYRKRSTDQDAPAKVIQADVRIDHEVYDLPDIESIEEEFDYKLTITRIRHEEDGPIELAHPDEHVEKDDVLTVVGPEPVVKAAIEELGHRSSHKLALDLAELDYRRATISNSTVAGRSIEELDLDNKFDAVISRVRRGDIDMAAHPELVLQFGDSVRVVAPRARMEEVSKFLGDSTRGLTRINPGILGVGLCLGMLLGIIPFPLPGGGSFHLGAALGSLIVGLVMGRVGRVGPVVTSLPFTATAVLSELGLLLFLAQAGTRAGGQILKAFASGEWLSMALLGAIITLSVALFGYFFQRGVVPLGGTKLMGVLAGTQTQPALLAYANDRTGHDFRVAMGYAMAYPMAMVMKILVASVIVLLG